MAETTLTSYYGSTPTGWVAVSEWTRDSGPRGTVVAGDGAFEEDGFVALLDADGEFVFSVFLDFAEPFTDILIGDRELLGTTDMARWRFDLDEPWRIEVEHLPPPWLADSARE